MPGLAFPGGTPGFDPTHLAAWGMGPKRGFSAIACGANFLDLLGNRVGAVTGTPAAKMGPGGPSVQFSGANVYTQFAGNAPNTAATTLAAIVIIPNHDTGFNNLVSNAGNAATGGVQLIYSGNGFGINNWGGGNPSVTVPQVDNTPFFVACSQDPNTANMVSVNLATGQIYTGTSAGATATTPAATYTVGYFGTGGAANPIILAAMCNPSLLLSLPQLIQWARDPGSFWHSQKSRPIYLFSPAAIAGYTPYNPWPQAAPVLAQ